MIDRTDTLLFDSRYSLRVALLGALVASGVAGMMIFGRLIYWSEGNVAARTTWGVAAIVLSFLTPAYLLVLILRRSHFARLSHSRRWVIAIGVPIVFVAFTIGLIVIGHRIGSPTAIPYNTETVAIRPDGMIRIERVSDAEFAFAAIGMETYVFRHSGGELTADFKVFHRPAGADAVERVVFEGSGDGTVLLFQSEADEQQKAEPSGMIVAAMPESIKQRKGNFAFALTLSGVSSRATAPASDVLPQHFSDEPKWSSGTGGAKVKSVEIRPGETVVLAESKQWLRSEGDPAAPLEERDLIRIVLTATALEYEASSKARSAARK